MTDETILQLGGFCTELLSSEMFDALTKLYSQQMAVDMLQTQPHEQKKREGIYAAYQGFEEFLALTREFSEAHNKLLQKLDRPVDHSQFIEPFDDPSVHDIYRIDID